MNVERKSLSELEQEQASLSHVLEQRRNLYNVVGTGRVRFGSSWEADLQIGKTRTNISGSITRFETSLSGVQQTIQRIRESQVEKLVIEVQTYIDEVAIRRTQLEEIRKYARLGSLPQDILERREAEYRQLSARPGSEPDLKRGIDLLKEKKRKEQEELVRDYRRGLITEEEYQMATAQFAGELLVGIPTELAPVEPRAPEVPMGPEIAPKVEEEPRTPLILDPNGRSVKIDDNEPVKMGELEFVLIKYIYDPKHLSEEIPSNVLQKILNEAGSRSQHIVSTTVFAIERKMGQELFKRLGKTFSARWAAMEQFEVSFVTAEPETADQEEDINSMIAEIQRLANRGVLSDSISLGRAQEIARQYGLDFWIYETSEPISGAEVTPPSRFRKLTAEEIAASDSKGKTNGDNGESDENNGNAQVREKKKDTRMTDEERKDRDELILLALDSIIDDQGSLTANEVLGLFGKMKNGRNYSYPAAINSIYRRITNLQRAKLENISDYEKKFLEKLRNYVGSEIDEDPQIVRTKLKEKLISWFKEKIRQTASQAGYDESGASIQTVPPADAEIGINQYVDSQLLTYTPGASEIERRDPNVHDRITEILDSLVEKHITRPVSNPQLTRFFPRVKHTWVNQCIGRGYITPERGRDHHPSFKPQEVAMLIYIREYGNNLDPRQVNDLRRLINSEWIKRNAQGNG